MFYLISSFVGAIIGYITNYIAIKMLFRPYKAKKLGSITIIPQGVIPKEKANLAKNIANIVQNHLLDKEELHKLITSDKFKIEIQNMISQKIDEFDMPNITEIIKSNPQKIAESISDFVMQMIASKFPFATAMISENMIKNMILENMDLLADKINAIFDIKKIIDRKKIKQNLQNEAIKFLENKSYKVIENFEIGKVVEKKVNNFDEKKLEDILFSLMDKHFKFINIAGAVLGAIIGLIQAFVLLHLK